MVDTYLRVKLWVLWSATDFMHIAMLTIQLSWPWHPTQPCAPLVVSTRSPVHPDPTRSTPGPFRPLSSPSHALCSICDAYVSVHDAMLLPSDLREHHWPIVNTHNQMQIMELTPKLAWARATPRTCIHAHTLPSLLLISSLFPFHNHFGFSSSRFYFCTLVLSFMFSLLIPSPTHPWCLPLSSVVASYCTQLTHTPRLIASCSRSCI